MSFWLAQLFASLERMMRDALTRPDRTPSDRAQAETATTISEFAAMADIQGRIDQTADAKRIARGEKPKPPSLIIPAVRLTEQLHDLATRDPTFALDAERVAELYRYGHGFAAARAASETVAREVRDYIIASRESATASADPVAEIARIGNRGWAREAKADMKPWTRAYAETVYETNLRTAHTAGRMERAREPAMLRAIPAFEYQTAGDSIVRRSTGGGENHAALDGMIRAVQWDGWRWWAPPGGYRCRCTIIGKSAAQLRRLGLLAADGTLAAELFAPVPAAARFHPRFQPKAFALV